MGLNLALNYGLELASAEMAWLDSTLDGLSKDLPSEKIHGSDSLV